MTDHAKSMLDDAGQIADLYQRLDTLRADMMALVEQFAREEMGRPIEDRLGVADAIQAVAQIHGRLAAAGQVKPGNTDESYLTGQVRGIRDLREIAPALAEQAIALQGERLREAMRDYDAGQR